MPKYLSEEKNKDDLHYRMVCINVHETDNALINPVSVYADVRDADKYARKLSMLVPDTGSVTIEDGARIRARYHKGERIQQTPLEHFYILTEEEITDSKIWCSKTCSYF